MSSIELPEYFLGAIMDGNCKKVFGLLRKQTFTQHELIEALNTAIFFRKDTIAFALLVKIDDVNNVLPNQDTQLQTATSMGNYWIVIELISRGAHINLKGNRLQPIFNAILAENYMIIAYLLLHGAKMNGVDQHMLETTFTKDYHILTRLYSHVQFIKKIPDKYKSEVEGLKAKITLGNLSESLDIFDREYTALRKKHSGLRFSKSSGFKMSNSLLPELPLDLSDELSVDLGK